MSTTLFNKSEESEQAYLEEIKGLLQQAIIDTDTAVNAHAREIQETKDYLYENKAGMDHVEKVSVRQSISQTAMTGDSAVARKKRLAKLINSPYFGRIDFAEKGEPNPVYIGIHAFLDQKENVNLIHDWRAPVSGMFYDYELGKATYQAPYGAVSGEITLKRQYRIRHGKMEFMLQSALNIHDDILQQELSRNASEKMKNIVATIQRDQNAIIRNEDAHTIIIQGVAGSGKTSIALHRIAFLLYRYKDTIKSDDILILSPNKVFADYISNVLPELGEERIAEKGMEELANELLEGKYKFQTFFEQVALLLAKDNATYKERISFKSSYAFIQKLDEYYVYFQNQCIKPELVKLGRFPIPASYIAEKLETYHRLPLLSRIPAIVKDIENDLMFYNRHEVNAIERNHIRKSIAKMFETTNLRNIYKAFYQWIGKPEYLKMAKGSVYEYADIFPLIYLKFKLEGSKSYNKVKHLVIDEMQDYTPLQYRVIASLFPCKKTILGDSFQSVNPYSSSDRQQIAKIFPNSESVSMNKSYRSTFEITAFAQRIKPNEAIEVVERHGEKPALIYCKTEEEEQVKIKSLIAGFLNSGHKSLGIVCKTQPQAEALYEQLKGLHSQLYVLDEQSTLFANGIVITSAHMAKGLEFDEVIVVYANANNYKTETDKQMLYIGCTRAMHQLNLTYSKKLSPLISV